MASPGHHRTPCVLQINPSPVNFGHALSCQDQRGFTLLKDKINYTISKMSDIASGKIGRGVDWNGWPWVPDLHTSSSPSGKQANDGDRGNFSILID